MKRNSTTLFLASPGATTPIPWVSEAHAPDFSGFTEPTLSVLTKAWGDFVDSGGELEVIPDPVPVVEEPVPDWTGFYDGLIMSATYNHLLGLTVPYPSISGVMAVMGVSLLQGQSDPSNPSRLAALQAAVSAILSVLNALEIPLTTEQLAEVRGLLDGNGFNEITLG